MISTKHFVILLALASICLPGCTKDNDIDYGIDGEIVNGIVWAKSNLGETGVFAASPEEQGLFYQWNRRTSWPNTGEIIDWDMADEPGDAWSPRNNPCPRGWRVPNHTEMMSLANESKVSYELFSVGNRTVIQSLYPLAEHLFQSFVVGQIPQVVEIGFRRMGNLKVVCNIHPGDSCIVQRDMQRVGQFFKCKSGVSPRKVDHVVSI